MLSHTNLALAAEMAADVEPELELGRELVTVPLSHSFGLVLALTEMFTRVAKSWFLVNRFRPGEVLALIEQYRIDYLQVVPSMLQLLLSQRLESFGLSSLRLVFSGGSPLPPDTIAEFKRRAPSVTLTERYGLTETVTALTCNVLGTETHSRRGRSLVARRRNRRDLLPVP